MAPTKANRHSQNSKAIVIISILLLTIGFTAFGQGFIKEINTSDDVMFYDFIEDSDSNFIFCGVKGNYNGDESDDYQGYIYKINSLGDSIQDTLIGEIGGLSAFTVVKEHNNNYYFFGGEKDTSTNRYSIVVLITDKNLNVITRKQFNSIYEVQGLIGVRYDSTKNIFIAAGYSIDSIFTQILYYIIDINGDPLYSKTLNFMGTVGFEIPFDIFETSSGYKSFSFINYRNRILNLNSIFDTVSSTPFETIYSDCGRYITINQGISNRTSSEKINDSTYLVSVIVRGSEYLSQPGEKRANIGLFTISENDSIQDFVCVGTADTSDFSAFEGLSYGDNQHVFIGNTKNYWIDPNFPVSQVTTWLNYHRLDINGNIFWSKEYGGDAFYYLVKILATQDGGALIMGWKSDYLNNSIDERDVIIIKVDENGEYKEASGVKNISTSISNLKVYPNPFNSSFTVILSTAKHLVGVQVKVINVLGQLQETPQQVRGGSVVIDGSHLSSGIYHLEVWHQQKLIGTAKIVKR